MYLKRIFFGLAITTYFLSCKTDFEVNAPYDQIPVVYGILDPSVDTQFLKINRSFLGTGDILQYAAMQDCTLFKNVTARIEEISNGNIQNVYNLQEMWVKNIESGIFYGDSQKVYFFVEPNLNLSSNYKLSVKADEHEVEATTDLIGLFDFSFAFKTQTFNGVALATGVNAYSEIKPRWNTGDGGKRYDVSLRFKYEEHKTSGTEMKQTTMLLGSETVLSTGPGQELLKEINGEVFYQFLGNRPELKDTVGVTKRVIKGIDFIVTVANEEFNTYMEVNEPVTGVITEKPEYTNLSNGVGLFASRYNVVLDDLKLTEFSIQELYYGKYTKDMKFCTNDPAYSSEVYFCP